MTESIDVACFGEVLWDIFDVDGDGKEPIGRTFRRELGGAPANLAVALARLGVSSSIIGGIGDDLFGKALERALAADRVSTKFLVTLPERTGLTFVTRSDKGEPKFLFYRHETADVSIRASHVTAAMGKVKFGVVGTSTLMTKELSAATYAFIDALAKNKADLVVDLNVRAHLWDSETEMKKRICDLASRAAVVKASESDLAALAGKRGLSWLDANAKNATWLLTRGENGAAAIGAHGQVTAPTKRVRAIDTTGAGDAFLSGALSVLVAAGARPEKPAWKDAKTWTRALEAGHLMGAKAVSQIGAVSGLVHMEDVKTKLAAAKKG